jgi:uroporphyrinogen-III synthase
MNAEGRRLFERRGATVIAAPALKEVALADQAPAFEFGVQLMAGQVDVLVLLTGVGTRLLIDVLCTRYDRSKLLETIQQCTLVCRGPKPGAALKGYGLKPDVVVPEPNTWRDIVATFEERKLALGKRVFVQEYGRSNEQLLSALEGLASTVSAVTLYGWALPDDTRPIETAIAAMTSGNADVACFTAGVQLEHLFAVAERLQQVEALRKALSERMAVASIGPMTTERLQDYGLHADIEPVHPKLGHLVQAIAEQARQVLAIKSQRALPNQSP